MTRKPWAFDHVRGQSTEIFLDGSTGAYVQMLTDELLPMIDGYVAAHGYLVGWIAIRFTGPTQALLGMQRWNPTVAIEVAVLRGTAHADALLRGVQTFAIRHGGTVHWGQQIDLGPAEIEAMYPELPVWRTQLRLLAPDQTGLCTFDNDACRQLGLTP
jgi:hypothetical protein